MTRSDFLKEPRARLKARLSPPPPTPAFQTAPHDILLDFLASYRLTHLVTTDRITSPLRDKAIQRARESKEGDPERHPSSLDRSLAYLVTCDYCVSIYTSTLLSLVHLTPATTPAGAMLRTARYALATAGAVGVLREVLDR